jgi:hypothetical protein
MSVLSDFIWAERFQYTIEDGNIFARSLAEASRYYDFLLIIVDRYRNTSKKMVLINKKEMKLATTQTGVIVPVTVEQMRLMEEWSRLNTLVQLEIESFYQFAKIFLDKIALFIQRYFGQAQGISLRSHDKWTKNHDAFRLAKGLTYPHGFSQTIILLNKHIVDFRDKQITHLYSQSTTRATTWGNDAHMRIAAYHMEKKEQAQSVELPTLIQAIDKYIMQLITVIESNRAKTRFKLRQS